MKSQSQAIKSHFNEQKPCTGATFSVYVPADLPPFTRRSFRTALTAIEKAVAAAADAVRSAAIDATTGLLGRRAGEEILRLEIARAKRGATPVSLLFVDVDGLRSLNTEHGHRAGDRALQIVGRS